MKTTEKIPEVLRFRDPTEDRMHLPPDWVEVVPPGWGTRGKSYYKNSSSVHRKKKRGKLEVWRLVQLQCNYIRLDVGGKVGKGSISCK